MDKVEEVYAAENKPEIVTEFLHILQTFNQSTDKVEELYFVSETKNFFCYSSVSPRHSIKNLLVNLFVIDGRVKRFFSLVLQIFFFYRKSNNYYYLIIPNWRSYF